MRQRLAALNGAGGREETDAILRHRLGLSPEQRILHARGEVSPRATAAVRVVVERREQGQPLAYALGKADFCGQTFSVTPDVLIPRQDTEWLVRCAEEWIREQRRQDITLLDLGCGSGCIGITLARRFPELQLILADVSQPALNIALKNAAEHGVAGRCQLQHGDWFSWAKRRERFDAIVCNPPYITRHDDPELEEAVRLHEPSLALFLEDDPKEFYFRLGRKAVSHLRSGGLFAVEVGYDTAWQAKSALNKIKALTPGRQIHDFSGIERVIWGIRK